MYDIAPPPEGWSSALRGVTIIAFVLAGIFALTTGLALYAATHRPMPPTGLVDRVVAGWDANCGTSVQIAVNFAADHEMESRVDQLRAQLDVVDIYTARQRENGSRHRLLLRALAAGPEGDEALVRDEDQPATVWLRLAGAPTTTNSLMCCGPSWAALHKRSGSMCRA